MGCGDGQRIGDVVKERPTHDSGIEKFIEIETAGNVLDGRLNYERELKGRNLQVIHRRQRRG
jgi:hypothetical protein